MLSAIQCPSAMVPEDFGRLVALHAADFRPDVVARLLREDFVVLWRKVPQDQVDRMLTQVCEEFGLLERLKGHATYASHLKRQRIGDYQMTVSRRREYQFIPPHSEGDSQNNIQLTSFYCYENTTDGGESIFLNVDSACDLWYALREKVVRISRSSREPTVAELRRARALYRLRPSAFVLDDDRVIDERESEIPGIVLADVLAKAKKTRSTILGRDLYAYWATIAIHDMDSFHAYVSLLEESNLLRHPEREMGLPEMDPPYAERCWSSNVDHSRLFKSRLTHKLQSGDFVLFNNMTWAHAAANWTPGSGVRNVAAAFA